MKSFNFFFYFFFPLALLVFLLFINTSFCSQNTNTTIPFDNSQFVSVNGVNLHYRSWVNEESPEQKPWIMLIHGFAGSTYMWHKNIKSLNDAGFNVVAVDVPPFGYSDKSLRINHSVDNRAELLWQFASIINPRTQWILFGHSMGGGIVEAMALLQPQRVERVVFVAPALFSHLQPERTIRQRIISFPPIEWILGGLGNVLLIRPKRIEKLLESAYGQKGTSEDVLAYYTPLKQMGMARAIISAFSRSKPNQNLNIADFKNHALAIWGEDDTWVPFERIKPYTEAMDNLSIVIIKDTGHNPMETDAELFNRIVLEYLLVELH
jgi:pimeloyl-ACP methyl ester carboxylesterase